MATPFCFLVSKKERDYLVQQLGIESYKHFMTIQYRLGDDMTSCCSLKKAVKRDDPLKDATMQAILQPIRGNKRHLYVMTSADMCHHPVQTLTKRHLVIVPDFKLGIDKLHLTKIYNPVGAIDDEINLHALLPLHTLQGPCGIL